MSSQEDAAMNHGRLQLQELVVRYCGWGGSSRGVRRAASACWYDAVCREFIGRELVKFAEANPAVQINVVRVNNQHPIL